MAITVKLPDDQRLELDAPSITIGRDASCRIHLDDPSLEPVHARLRKMGGRWLIESNGDWPLTVGDSPAGRTHWLQPGDTIELTAGGPQLTFEPPKDAAPAQTDKPAEASKAEPAASASSDAPETSRRSIGTVAVLALGLLLVALAGWYVTRDNTPLAQQPAPVEPGNEPKTAPPDKNKTSPEKQPNKSPPQGKVGLWEPTKDPEPLVVEPPAVDPSDRPRRDPLPSPDGQPHLVQAFRGHEHFVSQVAFISNTQVLSTSFDQTVRVWTLGKDEAQVLEGHQAAVTALAISADRKLAVTGDRDGRVIQWNLETLARDRTIRTADSSISSLALTRGGEQLLVVTLEGVEIWDREGSSVPRALGGRGEFRGATASANGSRLWAWRNGRLQAFDAAQLTPAGQPRDLDDDIESLAVSSDGTWFASASRNGKLHVWQPGAETTQVLDAQAAVHELAFTPDARWLVSAGQDRLLRLWDTARGKLLYSFEGHTAAVRCLAISPDGQRVASGSTDTTVRVWQLPAADYTFPALARTDPPSTPDETPPEPAVRVNPPAEVPKIEPIPEIKRAAAPGAQDQLAARRKIKGLFEAEYAERTTEGRRNLARRLLEQGRDPANTGVTRYVLLSESHELAAQAADAQLAFAAADALALWYQVDPLTLKQEALATAVPAATVEESRTLAERCQALITELSREDRYDVATGLVPLAITAARKAQDETLLAEARDQGDRVRQLRREYQRIANARERLADDADDASALGQIGRFRCFYKGDWNQGLPMLARCDDEKLAKLAAKDISQPQDAAARIAVGDAWWELARTHRELARDQLRAHAIEWYRLALPDAAGLERVRIEKRISAEEE